MAVCTLDVSHPRFVAPSDPELQEALQEMKKKVEAEHTSCNRVVQTFGQGKYPELHGKIWKYDWGKTSASGRKSWRLVVVVPDPTLQPYELIAGAVYAKSAESQLSYKELARIFAQITMPAIVGSAADNESANSSGDFHRVSNGDGQLRSICITCLSSTPVSISADLAVLDKAEQEHRCDLSPAAAIDDLAYLESEPE
jgi:hypothetical protein